MPSLVDRVAALSPEQRALFEMLRSKQQKAGPRTHQPPPIPRRSGPTGAGDWPLSYDQERLWFLYHLDPGSTAYNIDTVTRLFGRLDLPVFHAAFDEIVRRQAAWRTSFHAVDGRPVQRVHPRLALTLPVVDLSGLPRERREEAAMGIAWMNARLPFRLEEVPLVRVCLMRLAPEEHLCLVTVHHIATDWFSFQVFWRELSLLYAAGLAGRPSPLPELPFQYADFALWQRDWLTGEVLERQLSYWRERLAGAPTTELPADRPRPRLQTFRGATLRVVYPRPLVESIAVLARRGEASSFMALLTAFQGLIGRYTGQEDVVVGSPVANRTQPGLERLIGFFVNSLVLRSELGRGQGFMPLLARVREVCLGAYAHQGLPFEQLVEELKPQRDLSRNPLFQVMLNLLNLTPPLAPVPASGSSELSLSPLPPPGGTALFDLQAYVTEVGEGLAIAWEHNTDLFDRATIERFSAHFETLLSGIAADPECPLSELPLLSEAERRQLAGWNDTTAALPSETTVHGLIAAQVLRSPEAVALRFEGESLTYRELAVRAGHLARRLRGLGAGPGTLVAVCLERSAELVAALLAVLESGAAYVPLDPSHPAERLSFVLSDSGAMVLLTDSRLADAIPGHGTVVVEVDHLEPAEERRPVELPSLGPEDLAYVIYTSGSTGRPKGVEVRHGGVVNFLAAMARQPGLTATDTVLAVTTVAFDIAGLELWLPLVVGGRIELASRETATDGARLATALAGATVLQATPATWRLLLAAGWPGQPGLKALCGGEALPRELAHELSGRVGELWNVYGPTETTVWSTVQRVVGKEGTPPIVPIGHPIANTTVHLLDGLEPVPVGVAGELYLGGLGLARGYRGRPALTAERFVPDPFCTAPGERLYRTGDLARWRPDGSLEYLGRIDRQVKIRGFRVEPGEIESVLGEQPGVTQTVVVAREEGAGDRRLVAYVVRQPGRGLDAGALREALRARLPAYMVPAAFVELESLPLTPSGKVDRAALPRPDGEPTLGTPGEPPRTPDERALGGIFAAVLGIAAVGRDEGFFDLGGHSLLASQVAARVRVELGVELPLRTLFEHPTVARLAERVAAERQLIGGRRLPPLVRREHPGPAPLSLAQQRLWVLDQLEPGNPFYNLSMAVRLSGPLDVPVLAGALAEVARRHGTLRTILVRHGDEPVQVVLPPAPLPLPLADLMVLPEVAREREARRLVRLAAREPFDLARGPVVRTRLLRLGPADHVFACAMHHVVSDFISLTVLVREVTAFYLALARGERAALPEPPIQYADFAVWQREWLAGEVLASELAFWRERLAGAPAVVDLPFDRPRPLQATFRGASRGVALPAALAAGIEELGRRSGCTLYMTLLAGWQALLSCLSGLGGRPRQEDVVVGSPIAGRDWAEVEGLIGFFVNTLVMRNDLSGDPTFRELLARTCEMALAAIAHRHVPFDRVVEELKPERSLALNPLFQVAFNFLETGTAETVAALAVTPYRLEDETAQFDLVLVLGEGPDGLAGTLQYKTDLFESGTVDWIVEQYRSLLERAVAEPEVRLSELGAHLAEAAERRRAAVERELEEASAQRFKSTRRRAVTSPGEIDRRQESFSG